MALIHRHPVVGLLAGVLLLGACGDAATTGEEPAATQTPGTELSVVVTTSILGDLVRDLVGEDGEVEVLMGPGVDPHTFAPSAAQAAAIHDADLVVAVGLGLEESLVDLLGAAAEDGARVLELGPEVDPLPFAELAGGHEDADAHADEDEDAHGHEDEDAHTEDDGHGHAAGDADPHIWFDPLRMADAVGLIAEALADVDDTLDDEEWQRRGADHAARLVALDEELQETFASIPEERRVLVTNHEAIGYLAHRYDFEVIGTVIPGGGTDGGADAARLAGLAELIRETGVPAIFAENTTDDRVARTLAREVGRDVEVVTLYTDALGEAGSGAESYEGLLRTDAQLIADALS